jgi:hypothetical protein
MRSLALFLFFRPAEANIIAASAYDAFYQLPASIFRFWPMQS